MFGAYLLSKQRLDKRPWIVIDFKDEELWDRVKRPAIQDLKLGTMPGKRGLYRVRIDPWQSEDLEEYLKDIWSHGNIGLFVDEVSLIPQRDAFKAILRQGRSRLIPVIACTQRPVDCDREVFTESNYMACFRLKDIRDYKIVQGMTGTQGAERHLPPHWCWWYDAKENATFPLRPCPPPDSIASDLRDVAPVAWWNR